MREGGLSVVWVGQWVFGITGEKARLYMRLQAFFIAKRESPVCNNWQTYSGNAFSPSPGHIIRVIIIYGIISKRCRTR